jgi:ATP-dependent exoDNAse (exonuclease V) alpha subunit
LRDERTGTLYNYSGRQDVLHREITLPARFSGSEAEWARDRSTLWNMAERAEVRRDSRVAREYMLALPAELNSEQRVSLTRALSRDLADRYGVAIDAAIHAPRADGDQRNFHVHLLSTTREITASSLGAKTGLDMNGRQRRTQGLIRPREEFLALRERTANYVNEALATAQVAVRVDHRSLAAQGIDREPTARLPWGAYLAEKRGLQSDIADRVRNKYRARIQARAQAKAAAAPAADATSPLDEVRRQARENWLQMRAVPPSKTTASIANVEAGKEAEPGLTRAERDHDFAL